MYVSANSQNLDGGQAGVALDIESKFPYIH